MFGSRLVPSVLIGIALASIMFVIGGVATIMGILPAGANVAFGLTGFATSIGIGLHKDAKEAMKNDAETTEE